MIHTTERARAGLAVVSLLLIGAVSGVVLDRTVLIPVHAHAATAAAGHGAPRDHEDVLAELDEVLGLTPAQSVRLREIFAGHQEEVEAAWAEVHARLLGAIQGATADVETVLDPAQVQRLHTWLAEHHGPIPGHEPGEAH